MLMRSSSVNNMMLAKAPSLDHEDTPWSANFAAIVPHLGAHLAELTSINEGNGDYLADRPYLFSTHKLALLAGTLSLLHKMQQLEYNLTPVRCIAAALNFIAKTHLKLSASSASEYAKKMYALSAAVEPNMTDGERNSGTGSTAPALRPQKSATARPTAPLPPVPLSPTGRPKYRKSDAYAKITRMSVSGPEGNPEEAQGSGEEDEDEDEESEEPVKQKSMLSRPFKLMRKLTTAFLPSSSTK
jgi:hypothetical protein